MKKKIFGLVAGFAIAGMTLSAVCTAHTDNVYVENTESTQAVYVQTIDQEPVFAEDIRVFINGEPAGFELPPAIQNGRTLLPVRGVVEAIGGSVDWDETSQKVTLVYDSDVIELTIGSTTAYLNGEEKTLDAAPCIMQSRTLLPIRFVAESFGHTVEWYEDTRSISILPLFTPEMQAKRDGIISLFELCGGSYVNDGYFTKMSETLDASEAMSDAILMWVYMPVSGFGLNLEVGDTHQGGLSYVMTNYEYDETENTYTINFECTNGQTDNAVLLYDADDDTAVYTGITLTNPEIDEIKMNHFGFSDEYSEIYYNAYLILKDSPDAEFDGEAVCAEVNGAEYYLAIHMDAVADSAEASAMFDKGAKGYVSFIPKGDTVLDSLYYYFIEDDVFTIRDENDNIIYSAKIK